MTFKSKFKVVYCLEFVAYCILCNGGFAAAGNGDQVTVSKYTVTVRPNFHSQTGTLNLETLAVNVTIRVKVINVRSTNLNLPFQLPPLSVVKLGVARVSDVKGFEVQRRINYGGDFLTFVLPGKYPTETELDVHIPLTLMSSFCCFQQTRSGFFLKSGIGTDGAFHRLLPTLFNHAHERVTVKLAVAELHDGKYHSISNAGTDSNHIEPDNRGQEFRWNNLKETPPIFISQFFLFVSDFSGQTLKTTEPNKSITTWSSQESITQNRAMFINIAAGKLIQYFEKELKRPYPFDKLDIIVDSSMPEEQKIPGAIFLTVNGLSLSEEFLLNKLSNLIARQWFGGIIFEPTSPEKDALFFQAMVRLIQTWRKTELPLKDVVSIEEKNEESSTASSPPPSPAENCLHVLNKVASKELNLLETKTLSLLKMIESTVTSPIMKTAFVDVFIKETSVSEGFGDSIQTALEMHNATHLLPPNVTMKFLIEDWMKKSKYGFPLFNVDVNTDDANPFSVIISQRFLEHRSKTPTNATFQFNWLPISVLNSTGGHLKNLWIPRDTNVTFSSNNSTLAARHGFYRIIYDSTLTKLISQQLVLNHTTFSPALRVQLLEDYFALIGTPYVSIGLAMEITKYLEAETELQVWTPFLALQYPTEQSTFWDRIANEFQSEAQSWSLLRSYFLLEGALEKSEVFKDLQTVSDSALLRWCLRLNGPTCTNLANSWVVQWENETDCEHFPYDLASVIYCSNPNGTSDESWSFLFAKLKQHRLMTHEKLQLLTALACTKNETLLRVTLNQTLQDATQFSVLYWRLVRERPQEREFLYAFAKENFLAAEMPPWALMISLKALKYYSVNESSWNATLKDASLLNISSEEVGILESAQTRCDFEDCEGWENLKKELKTWLYKRNEEKVLERIRECERSIVMTPIWRVTGKRGRKRTRVFKPVQTNPNCV